MRNRNAMYDLFINAALVVVWGFVALLVVVKVKECRTFLYTLKLTAHGMRFKYSLGVYGGIVEVLRDPDVIEPIFQKRVNGWILRFPESFSQQDIYVHLLLNLGKIEQEGSHSKDLPIFKEVVIGGNDSLMCIGGHIYSYHQNRVVEVK